MAGTRYLTGVAEHDLPDPAAWTCKSNVDPHIYADAMSESENDVVWNYEADAWSSADTPLFTRDQVLAYSADLNAKLDAAEADLDSVREALLKAADQLHKVHSDAFRQAAGYGLVTADGRGFSCMEINRCNEAGDEAMRFLSAKQEHSK